MNKPDIELPWKFITIDGVPEKYGLYLCLNYNPETEKSECVILNFFRIDDIYTFTTPDDECERWINIVAWLDHTKPPVFECDPESNDECEKSFCSYYHLDGGCHKTTNLKYAINSKQIFKEV